ncbi:MAP/microtubule affinity-regulating kinase 3 [Phlyctochytrium bullatum]|nr:MAP/microtubule affinity-regulating kinase 3 [Phlyctochytrium bullatum]
MASVAAGPVGNTHHQAAKADLKDPAAGTGSAKVAPSKSSKHPERVDHYRIDKTIGQGTYGKVKLGYDTRTNEKVAIKVIEKAQIQSPKQVARLQREIRFLKLLYHPHIVKVYDVIEKEDYIYIVMEYAAGGELFDYIVAHKRVKEGEAREFFRMVLSAVDYCHKNAVIHRDLKPENLLLDDRKSIKIIDFGFGNNFTTDGLLDTFCGSPFYAAPEMILGKKYEGPEVDMWSLGVILFALLCGHLPFDDEDMKELYKKIASGSYTCPDYLLPNARHLISRLITVDPKKRATLQEVLLHPWVNEGHKHPPYNYLPIRPTSLPINQLSRDLVSRLNAFGYRNEDIHNAFSPKADWSRPDPIRSTYFLLKEMLEREEARMRKEAEREAERQERQKQQQQQQQQKQQQRQDGPDSKTQRMDPSRESLPTPPPASVPRPASLKQVGRWGSDAAVLDGSAQTLHEGWRESSNDVHASASTVRYAGRPISSGGSPYRDSQAPDFGTVGFLSTHNRPATSSAATRPPLHAHHLQRNTVHPAQLSNANKQQFRSLQTLGTDHSGFLPDNVPATTQSLRDLAEETDLTALAHRERESARDGDVKLNGNGHAARRPVSVSEDGAVDVDDAEDDQSEPIFRNGKYHPKIQSELQRPPPIASALTGRVARLSLGSPPNPESVQNAFSAKSAATDSATSPRNSVSERNSRASRNAINDVRIDAATIQEQRASVTRIAASTPVSPVSANTHLLPSSDTASLSSSPQRFVSLTDTEADIGGLESQQQRRKVSGGQRSNLPQPIQTMSLNGHQTRQDGAATAPAAPSLSLYSWSLLPSGSQGPNSASSATASNGLASPDAAGSTLSKLRTVNGWFMNVSTTSSKPPQIILNEVLRVLGQSQGVRHACEPGSFTVVCSVEVPTFLASSSPPRSSQNSNGSREEAETATGTADVEGSTMTLDEEGRSSVSSTAASVMAAAANVGPNSVVFQIEVCRIPRLNMCGLHFKRVGGGVWNYKKVCNKLLSTIVI